MIDCSDPLQHCHSHAQTLTFTKLPCQAALLKCGYAWHLAAIPDKPLLVLSRWYYAKGITTDEAYVFVCYDSRDGRARFTPHTGFKDPTTSPDALPRQSIEIRAYVFWENEPEQDIARLL